MTKVNITTSTVTINNYTSTYIPTKVCSTCPTIKYVTEYNKNKVKYDIYKNQCEDLLKI